LPAICINYTCSLFFNTASSHFIAKLKEDLFRRVFKLPVEFFDKKQDGYILERISEVDSLSIIFSPSISQLFSSFFAFFGALLIVSFISWKILLINLCFLPIFYLLTNKNSRRLQKSSLETIKIMTLSHNSTLRFCLVIIPGCQFIIVSS